MAKKSEAKKTKKDKQTGKDDRASSKPTVTPMEAAAILQREEAARRQAFHRSVQQLQQQFRLRIVPVPQLTPEGRITATLQYVPMQ